MFKSRYLCYLVKFSILPLLYFYTSMLLAAECFSPVPGLKQGEPYAHHPTIASQLSNPEHNTLRELLDGLDGNWQGDAEEELCLGDIDSARKKIKHYAMQAEVEVNSGGGLKIHADLESIEERTSHQETYRLFLNPDRLRVGEDSSKGDVELLELYPDSVTFVQSHILRSNIPQDVLTKITRTGTEIRIVRYFYNHGKLSSISRWKLRN